MHQIVEIQASKVDGDRFPECRRQAPGVDRVQHQIDRAALFQSRGGLTVDDMHGNADAHAEPGANRKKST